MPAPAAAQSLPCPGPTVPSSAPPPASRPWQDASLPPEQRTELLLAELTLEEKVDLATGELCLVYGFYNAPIERLGIPALTMADGPAGVRITYERVNGGRATQLPAPIALAATWDVGLAGLHGELLAAEALATGHNVLLGPTLDLARTPLAGRNFEGFGEDPLLAARLAVPFVRGVQRHPVLAGAKHFAAYNQETERFTLDARVDERALREVHLAPFEAAVREADVASVMCGFNRVNGVFACEHAELLGGLLKGELGFRGFVLSDWGAIRSTAGAALGGLDHEQPAPAFFGWSLLDAVARGEVPLAVLDDKARRILGAMFRHGLFDHGVGDGAFPEAEHGAAALRIAEQGIVLLKNDRGVLPLSPRRGVRSIAVIGADAASVAAQGGGAARVEPTYGVSVLDGVRARAGADVSVQHAPGGDPVSAAHLLPGLPAIPSSVLAPPGDPGGRGLLGEYWFGAAFDGAPWVVRLDPQVAVSLGFFNFPSVSASSRPQLPNLFSLRPFAARWTGTLTAPATGEYVLALTSRGRGSVHLDGAPVLERLDADGLATTTATVSLVEGERHDLRVEYVADDPAIGVAKDLGGDVALGWAPPQGALPPAVREAAALAAASDVAVVVVRTYESEGRDRPDLSLPNGQDELVRAVAAANPRTVVVLTTGQPVAMPWLDDVAAVVQAWYAGQEQGRAVARVLFGDVNPSGKLPVTFPRRLEDTPTAAPERFPGTGGADPAAEYGEGLLVGHRWYDARGLEPLFPFGHGLSYTTFRYGDLEVAPPLPVPAWRALPAAAASGPARVAFTVENTGARAGAEVAQIYVGACPGDAAAPPRRLAGFAKVGLAPGARRRVVVDLDPRALAAWSAERRTWVAAECGLRVWVGSSSRDVRLEGTLRPGGGAAAAAEPARLSGR